MNRNARYSVLDPLRGVGFWGPEFSCLSLDQWCSIHAKNLEPLSVRVTSVDGQLTWTSRSRRPGNSLRDSLGLTLQELEQTQYLLLTLECIGEEQLSEVVRQVSEHVFPVLIIDVPVSSASSFDDKASHAEAPYWMALESALFSRGIQKHPAYYELSGPTRRSDVARSHVGSYCYLPDRANNSHGLSFLRESRELHMDMCRETGPRSDSHILRYHFAAKRILAEVGPGATILDACCGMGYGTQLVRYFCQPCVAIGVDIDERAMAYAQAVHGIEDDVLFAAEDVLKYLCSLDAKSVDAVIMFEGLEHVSDVKRTLEEINRVLKPTGLFIASVPNSWVNEAGEDENPWHRTVFHWDNFREIISQHLTLDSTWRQIGNRYNDRGKWHQAKPCFESVDPTVPSPEIAEWWIAVSRPRSVPGATTTKPLEDVSFELQEALAKLSSPEIKVVSFDILDTLMARPTIVPEDVFYLLQQGLVEEHGELYSGFATLRRFAEHEARQIAHRKGLGDITYDEIYDRLASLMALSDAELDTLKQRELELENQLLMPRLGVMKIYARALELGKRVIMISDMYLSPAFLKRVLIDCGYPEFFKLWVSSEHKVQKRTGLLFETVLEELSVHNISASQVLHVGDNRASDIDAAAKYGMKTLHTPSARIRYAGPKELWPSGPKVVDLNKTGLGLRSFVGCQINETFQDPFFQIERGTIVDHSPYLFGRLRLAPFVYFAMDAFLRRCEQGGIERVLFATRDSHVARVVFERIAIERGLNIETQDLSISRSVLNLLQCQRLEQLCRFVTMRVAQGRTEGLLVILSSLTGQSQESLFARLMASTHRHAPTLLSQPLHRDQLGYALQALETIWPEIEGEIRARSKAAMAHISSHMPDEKTAVWDVGYFHSIANVLAAQGVSVGLSGHIVEIAQHESRVSYEAKGFDTHTFVGPINNTQDPHPFTTGNHSLLLELLLGDPSTASRVAFTPEGAAIVQPEAKVIQEQNRPSIDALHNGICDATEAFHRAFGTHLARVRISATEILQYSFHHRAVAELLTHSPLIFENNGHRVVRSQGGRLKVEDFVL